MTNTRQAHTITHPVSPLLIPEDAVPVRGSVVIVVLSGIFIDLLLLRI
jgi:hypothetical protein